MKKIFTLVCMAFVAMSVNAQAHEPGLYECKSITWGDITWKNNNNKKDNDNNDMLFLMGTGNGYATVLAEYFYSENQGDYFTRPAYTYIDYEGGETGSPAYGLYYKFTPKVNGRLRFNTWVNKGNRKTFVVKASDGKPFEPYVDYTFDGYVNGQNETKTIGEQDVNVPKYFAPDEIKARVDEENAKLAEQGKDPINKYVIEKGNQAVWGWITVDMEAGESYYIYQQSSQLGFGGYDYELPLWTGDWPVSWELPDGDEHKEWKGLGQEDFAAMEVGTVLNFYLKTTPGAEYQQFKMDDWGWTLLPGQFDTVFHNDSIARLVVTQDVKNAIAANGFALHGHGYNVTKVTKTIDSYVAVVDMGGTKVLAPDFAAVIDETGKATNVDIRGSVVNFATANMDVEACGGAVPTEVEADFGAPAGIEDIKTELNNSNAPMFNLAGQKVANDFKGMVIKNGKKFINK